jgi:hypothetical protein
MALVLYSITLLKQELPPPAPSIHLKQKLLFSTELKERHFLPLFYHKFSPEIFPGNFPQEFFPEICPGNFSVNFPHKFSP